jgi:hypothetical protein
MLQTNDRSSAMLFLAQRPETSFRMPRLPAPRRAFSKSPNFPEAVVACMVEARPPTQREIAAVAARIWKEWTGKAAASWNNVAPESAMFRKMIAAARLSLGELSNNQSPVPDVPPGSVIWWRTDRRRQP